MRTVDEICRAALEKWGETAQIDMCIEECSELQHTLQELEDNSFKLGYNRALEEVKEKVDKIYDDVGIGISEYDTGYYNGMYETCTKIRGFIKARMGKQEPEFNLEQEVLNWFESIEHSEGIPDLIRQAASHFYELGQRASDETIKIAEDHAYFAGKEKLREELLEWVKDTKYQCEKLKNEGYGDVFYGAQIAILEEMIDKLNQL